MFLTFFMIRVVVFLFSMLIYYDHIISQLSENFTNLDGSSEEVWLKIQKDRDQTETVEDSDVELNLDANSSEIDDDFLSSMK